MPFFAASFHAAFLHNGTDAARIACESAGDVLADWHRAEAFAARRTTFFRRFSPRRASRVDGLRIAQRLRTARATASHRMTTAVIKETGNG
jgi:hypothetical protein